MEQPVASAGAGVVLAAGQSSRMGSVKALLDAGDGKSLLRASCEALAHAGLGPVIAVLGHHRESLERELPPGALVAINPEPELGQVRSMAVGLHAAADAGRRWALVALVDQPPVGAETLAALARAAALEPDALHVPVCRGQRGHPIALPTGLARELAAARSGEGAREVLARLGTPVRELVTDDAGVLVDLDTPADVERWRSDRAPPGPSRTPGTPSPSTAAALSEAGLLAEAARRSAAREPFALCTVVATDRSAPREPGAKMLVAPDGSIAGTVGGGPLEASVVHEAAQRLNEAGASALLQFALDAAGDRAELLPGRSGTSAGIDAEAFALGMKCGGAVDIFIDVVRPPARLIVYGGGHVGERVAAIAAETGLHTVVVDDRPAFSSAARFPKAAEVRCRDLAQDPLGGLAPGAADFVVIVTRCHELDEGVLEAALATRARYVGLIGSRRKIALILRSIARRIGRDPRADPRLHAPIGLRLGDKTPGEIAISILAEVLLVKSAGALAHSRLPPREVKLPETPGGAPAAVGRPVGR